MNVCIKVNTIINDLIDNNKYSLKETGKMNEILAFIEQNKYGSLATCNGGKVDVRPFELVFHCNRGMFFYTSEGDDLYAQLNVNPFISFCATDKNYNYYKISGSVIFSNEENDKNEIIEKSQFAQKKFSNSNANDMKVFFLPHATCGLHYQADNKVVEWQF